MNGVYDYELWVYDSGHRLFRFNVYARTLNEARAAARAEFDVRRLRVHS